MHTHPLHEPTDEERYLAQPRFGPLLLSALGWALGGLVAALLVTWDSPVRDIGLGLYTGTFGGAEATSDGATPLAAIRIAGVVMFGIIGLFVGYLASQTTDLLYGVPKVYLSTMATLFLLILWIAGTGLFALTGLPFAVPVAGGLTGWMRARKFSPVARGVQAGAWVVFCVIAVAALGVLMWIRPDLGTVVRFG